MSEIESFHCKYCDRILPISVRMNEFSGDDLKWSGCGTCLIAKVTASLPKTKQRKKTLREIDFVIKTECEKHGIKYVPYHAEERK